MIVIKKFFQLCSIYTKARRTNWGEEVRMGKRKRQQKSKGNGAPHLVGCHSCSSKLSPHQVPTKETKQVKHPYSLHTQLMRQLVLSSKEYLRSHHAVLEFTKCWAFISPYVKASSFRHSVSSGEWKQLQILTEIVYSSFEGKMINLGRGKKPNTLQSGSLCPFREEKDLLWTELQSKICRGKAGGLLSAHSKSEPSAPPMLQSSIPPLLLTCLSPPWAARHQAKSNYSKTNSSKTKQPCSSLPSPWLSSFCSLYSHTTSKREQLGGTTGRQRQ